jgi:membrane protease subunit (stomatin/prohibitin family)
MALFDFIKKQFIDVIEWNESEDGVLAYRYPMQDNEIQSGAMLTVRESQLALFVNEGKIADQLPPGLHKLTTQTLPVMTNLRNWDKLFDSPFKSDVYYFSTRQQMDCKWGTQQPVTIRDKDFGAVRVRAFGNYSFHVSDPKLLFTQISGTRELYTVADLDSQLRGLLIQEMANAVANSGVAFLDLAANQAAFAKALQIALAPSFTAIGLALDGLTLQSLSLPEELQKILDQRIGMGMVGDTSKLMQYQTAQAIPAFAANSGSGSGVAGDAMGLGAGMAMGQMMAQTLQQGLNPAAKVAASVNADEVMSTIEKLHGLMTKGMLSSEEFAAKKSELLGKL